jgi:hypothetical protein
VDVLVLGAGIDHPGEGPVMWLRANIVLAVAVVFAVVQMFASATGGPRFGDPGVAARAPGSGLSQSVAAQEEDNEEDDSDNEEDDSDNEEDDSDNEEDDSDNDDDCVDDSDDAECDDDNEDSDNEDDDSDNEDDDSDNDEDDSDNEEDDSDNDDEEDSDNEDELDDDNEDVDDEDVDDEIDADNEAGEDEEVDADNMAADDDEIADDDDDTTDADSFPIQTPAQTTAAAPAPSVRPAASPSPSPVPFAEVQGVTTGADMLLALPGDRVAIQVFASTPANITLTLRLVDPLAYPAVPGIRAGNLIFEVVAADAFGAPLATLPAEVSLSVRYADPDVAGLDETFITLSRLDPLDQMWKTAPNLLVDPLTNSVMASVVDTGVFAVHVP